MADVKWIKITTDIFDDEKIKIIDTYPARDEMIVIWFKLLSLAGKVNKNGMLFLNDKIPCTIEMLSAIFNREQKSIQLALQVFEQFGMVSIEENEIISIANWDKHQNIDGLDKIREQARIRTAKCRENKKKLLECNVTSNVTVMQSNAIEIEKELELDIELDKEKEKNISYKNIINYLNKRTGSNYKTTTKKTQNLIKARICERFTEEDFIKVIDTKCGDWLHDNNMKKYLRPETLFGSKFESYLNQQGGNYGESNKQSDGTSIKDGGDESARLSKLALEITGGEVGDTECNF